MQATQPNVVVAAPKQVFTAKMSGRFLEEMPNGSNIGLTCLPRIQRFAKVENVTMRLSKCLCYSNDIDRTFVVCGFGHSKAQHNSNLKLLKLGDPFIKIRSSLESVTECLVLPNLSNSNRR